MRWLIFFFMLHSAGYATNPDCIEAFETYRVSGQSMSGIVEEGEKVLLAKGFYKCNPVERDDIVLYDYAGSDIPLIKSVKGLPGDSIQLKNGILHINGEAIKTASGNFYKPDSQAMTMLNLYINRHNQIIPARAFLLLGSKSNTLDSGSFGWVSQRNLIGKVFFK
ncbi:MAG: signal peptidase I [Chitinophagaceae bacterium]|nr:MAG: signal peptidase I [Chitinophagaceae bacterium]